MAADTNGTRRTSISRVRSFLDAMSGARECAAAVESGRKPSKRALNAIGLSGDAFDDIRLG